MSIKKENLRYNNTNVCKECHTYGLNCADSTKCKPVREELRDFGGVRLTSDGFDCALPLTIDSHSSCAYECLYCFSENITGHAAAHANLKTIGQTSLKKVEDIFAGRGGYMGEQYRKAIRYDKRNEHGYPTPVQLGGLCDSCDSIEQNQGWLLQFIDLAIKYNQPVRMSTKGAIFLIPEYLKRIAKAPHLFWVAFSMITDDDDIMRQIDRYAPDATLRLKTMKVLTDIGVKTSLRLRPIMLGISDRNGAYKSLIEKAGAAGAGAISYETAFYPSVIPKANKWKWDLIQKISGHDYRHIYSSFGKLQACTRPSYLWTENIMHDIKERALQQGMTVGVSDPVWKQLSDVGCCCGIEPTDPVFGNWEVENGTNAMCKGRDTGKLLTFDDIRPPWAKDVKAVHLFNMGAGAKACYNARHTTWEDKLRQIWNDLGSERSVMNYFQGALQPVGRDANGDRTYKYVGLERKHMKSQWEV